MKYVDLFLCILCPLDTVHHPIDDGQLSSESNERLEALTGHAALYWHGEMKSGHIDAKLMNDDLKILLSLDLRDMSAFCSLVRAAVSVNSFSYKCLHSSSIDLIT